MGKSRRSAVTPDECGYRLPAEWEPQAAVWLAWPASVADWPGKGGAIPWVFAELVRHLAESQVVRLIVPSAAARPRVVATLRRAGVHLDQVDFVLARVNRTWARDFLPTFVTRRPPRAPDAGGPVGPTPRGAGGPVGAVKWRFNGWARYANHQLDHAAGDAAARWLDVPTWHPEVPLGGRPYRVVLEGGAIDGDGEGTLLTTRECLLEGPRARNRKLGREGTEAVLESYLGVRRVIWMDRGIAGDDTSGHVDDFVRFVAPGRVVVCQETNPRDVNHAPLAAAERLRGARDAQGRRLEVVPLPMPDPVYFGRERLPASYANFYIGNSVVLVPTFNDLRDRDALGLLAELFPTRRVVGVHCLDLVLGLGTIHCSTMQEPLGFARPRRST